ncbi:MAG TPA: hypothetical protein VNM68_00385 [Candidatus Polarisedimenticolia bacterium]|nr:hypothetical protein [Candidatus Polarisedimenticolia bacterium]
MLHRKTGFALTILAALFLAAATWAGDAATPKHSKPLSTTVQLMVTSSLNGTTLPPGSYKVVANDSKVTIEQSGKVIAEAPVEWKEGERKARYSTVVYDNHGVREIHFDGKTRYVVVAD